MARYIDADKVMEEINRIGGHNLCEWETIGVKALIDRQPTADVAPRAEVDFLKKTIAENAQKALEVTLEEVENAKKKVAREIIDAFEDLLDRLFFDDGYNICDFEKDIAKLKNKYAEGKK